MLSKAFEEQAHALGVASDAAPVERRAIVKAAHDALKAEFEAALIEEYLSDVPPERRAEVGRQTLALVEAFGSTDTYLQQEEAFRKLAEYATAVGAGW